MCLAHGNELLYDNERRKNRIIKTLNQIRYIVSNSKYTNQLVKNLGINNNNTFVINPGAKDLRNLKGEKRMTEETNKWGRKRIRHTTRYSHEIYSRIQNLSRRNHVPFNQMVNHLLSLRSGVTMI